MIARMLRSLYEDGQGVRLGIPKLYAEAMGMKKGEKVEVFFDDVLVVVPRKSAQADRVLRAMREVR